GQSKLLCQPLIAVARARASRLPKELSTSSCNGLLGQNARGFHERRTVGRFAEIAMILLLLHTTGVSSSRGFPVAHPCLRSGMNFSPVMFHGNDSRQQA